jgi:TonB family protein
MSYVLLALFVVCPLARAQGEGGVSAPSSWRTFVSPGGGFSTDFPGIPQPRTEQTSKPGSTLTKHYYELVADSSRYVVGYVDTAPGSASAEQRVNASLNRLIAWYARQGGSEVARHDASVSPSCKVVDWQGISLAPNAPTLLVLRIVGTPKRSYFLMFASNRVGTAIADADKRFIESFKDAAYGCAAGLVFPSLMRPNPADGGATAPFGPIGPGPVSPVRVVPDGGQAPLLPPPGGTTTWQGGGGGGVGPGRGGNTGGGDRTQGVPRIRSKAHDDGVYNLSEVTRRAVITSMPQPEFTEKARRNQVAGTIRLRLVLRDTGRVSDISVVRGLPDGLNECAVEAARRIKFTPAEYEGRKVSQRVYVEYNFNIY